MPTIDDVIALYQDYHWPDELRMMNRLASQVKDGVIVAIGSYRGQMDCALALDATVPVYCIDSRFQVGTHYGDWDRPYWMQNVLAMGVAEKVRPINMDSYRVPQIWDESIGLLFIDGNHDEKYVYTDLKVWLPHVQYEGLIVMHDITFEGVQAAIARFPELIKGDCVDATAVYTVREVNV